MRFLRERIRLTQKAKGDGKREAEFTAQSITSALSTEDADSILKPDQDQHPASRYHHQRQTKAEV